MKLLLQKLLFKQFINFFTMKTAKILQKLVFQPWP
jgi:hypothetical protein